MEARNFGSLSDGYAGMPIEPAIRIHSSRHTRASHKGSPKPIDALFELVDTLKMARKYEPGWFEVAEAKIHAQVAELERELTAEVLAAHDVDAPYIEIEGKAHRRVLRSEQTYMTLAGAVKVERWLYRERDDESAPSLSPMEIRLGMIDFWTPQAAKTATWFVSQMVPKKAEEAFARLGGMAPSKSSLDRLPKTTSDRWEADREAYEAALRDAIVVPDGAVSVAVSIDGVMAPINGGANPVAVRKAAAEKGTICKGPAGYREVGCATLTFCDAAGEAISSIRAARAPEACKATLKRTLEADLVAVLRQRKDLKLVKVADGVDDNWRFLANELPEGEEVLDFFHACEHLHLAVAAAYGPSTLETRHRFEQLRHVLLEDEDGVTRVIRAIDHLRRKHPKRRDIQLCAAYLRKHRHRMNYAVLRARNLPIGSGLVEAACKTLVSQRLKLSGMRWGRGAQAILTLRGWEQSERFDQAWALLAAAHHVEVHVLAQIVPFGDPKSRRSRAG
jgi:hypothetical protein